MQLKTFDFIFFDRYDNNQDEFLVKVKECVDLSKQTVLEPPSASDPHAIVFTDYRPSIHDSVRHELKKERVRNPYPERL